jgi:signal transduction histidine kinase
MAPAFSSRGVQFCTRLQPDLPPVPADLHQIEQVLLNLVSNALDALPGGGRIEVETREVSPAVPGSGNGESAAAITGGPDATSVLLLVRDDGVGIAPAHLDHLFDPFFSTKGAGRGSGLGLAICKEIVSQHHGEIRIESEPGRGSCVMVRLPAVAPRGQAVA